MRTLQNPTVMQPTVMAAENMSKGFNIPRKLMKIPAGPTKAPPTRMSVRE
ncbi:MAG: hypothetical protein ACYCOR_21530 [Acidobacteriaceae bacterium]